MITIFLFFIFSKKLLQPQIKQLLERLYEQVDVINSDSFQTQHAIFYYTFLDFIKDKKIDSSNFIVFKLKLPDELSKNEFMFNNKFYDTSERITDDILTKEEYKIRDELLKNNITNIQLIPPPHGQIGPNLMMIGFHEIVGPASTE